MVDSVFVDGGLPAYSTITVLVPFANCSPIKTSKTTLADHEFAFVHKGK
jgi:hypothetical protein